MDRIPLSKKQLIFLVAIAVAVLLVVLLLISGSCHGSVSQSDQETTSPFTVAGLVENAQEKEAEAAEERKAEETEDFIKNDKKTEKKETGESKETSSGEPEETKDGKKTCKLTIHNGAASANTKEAVNGLHVYDPNSADLEDFFSGAEVPAGTAISIYVYNLASPVSLHVEHNGVTVADRTYAALNAWVDDDKVEFINLVLEGDLVVETKALPASALTESKVSINNEALGSVKIGSTDLHDGDTLRNGTSDFTLRRADIDVNAAVRVDGKNIGSVSLTKQSPEAVVRSVTYNNSTIEIVFTPIDDQTPIPDPPKKSTIHVKGGSLAKLYRGTSPVKDGDTVTNGTYDFKVITEKKDIKIALSVGDSLIGKKKVNAGMNEYTFRNVTVDGDVKIVLTDVTPETEETSFRVTVDNRVPAKDAVLTVGYVNDKEEAVAIVSGKKYEKGLVLGARALNKNSARKLKLTAYNSSGEVLDSVKISKGTASNPGANGFYLMLSDHTTYVLEYADKAEKTTTKEPEKTRKPEKTTEEPTTRKPENETTYKVMVKNGAASANTDEAVNGLHVYDLNDPDLEDIEGTKKLKKGSRIRIYAYPLASDIRLTIVHDGKTVADKKIKKMKAWVDDDKIQYFDIKLKGDLVVKTEEYNKTPETTSIPEPVMFEVAINNAAASANTSTAANELHVFRTSDSKQKDLTGTVKLEKDTKLRIRVSPKASDVNLRILHDGKTVVNKDLKKNKEESFDFTLSGSLKVTTTALLPEETESVSEETTTTQQEETTQEETTQEETTQEETTQEETEELQYQVTIKNRTGLSDLL